MKHEELKELLPLYVDGGLDIDEIELIEKHIKECEECSIELAEYQKNYDLLSTVEEVEVSDEFLFSVMEKVQGENSVKRVRRQSKDSFSNRVRNLFKIKLQVPVGAMGAIAAVLLLVILIRIPFEGFGGTEDYFDEGSRFFGNYQTEMSPSRSEANPKMLSGYSADSANASSMNEIEAKIIQTANLVVEVKDINIANKAIAEIIENFQGYISDSRSWVTSDNQQHSRFQLRISAPQFEQTLLQIEKMGRITSHSTNKEDVTEEYIDVESRLENLKLQEQRYRELLNKAHEVEDILKIERELERVRSTIESLQGRMNYLVNKISLSTIYLDLNEPEPITSSDAGILKAIRQALRVMVNTFYGMIVGLGGLLPYVMLLLIIYGAYRVSKGRR
ncbi:MAG: DUF4349 domain-containing protein [Halanaerobiales bacterium]|nr:DUF4349 domain-containing protein [Halanaerobiales bacterium]